MRGGDECASEDTSFYSFPKDGMLSKVDRIDARPTKAERLSNLGILLLNPRKSPSPRLHTRRFGRALSGSVRGGSRVEVEAMGEGDPDQLRFPPYEP